MLFWPKACITTTQQSGVGRCSTGQAAGESRQLPPRPCWHPAQQLLTVALRVVAGSWSMSWELARPAKAMQSVAHQPLGQLAGDGRVTPYGQCPRSSCLHHSLVAQSSAREGRVYWGSNSSRNSPHTEAGVEEQEEDMAAGAWPACKAGPATGGGVGFLCLPAT